MFSPEERSFDLSLVLILVMAVATVMLGSLWSGYAKQSLRLRYLRYRYIKGQYHKMGFMRPWSTGTGTD
jgi:hypothetical protein